MHFAYRLILVVLLIVATRTALAEQRTLFVATNGNDVWTGTLSAPNPDRSDGPLATPAVARDRARTLRDKIPRPGQIVIRIRGGTYELREPLTLGVEDSGADGLEIVYEAYPNERPVLSGGRRLGPWRSGRFKDRDVWIADLPGEFRALPKEERGSVRELFVNNARCPLARAPDSGYLEIESMPDGAGKPWNEGGSSVRFKAADAAAWADAIGADLVVMNRWVDCHSTIAAIDANTRTATLASKSLHTLDPNDIYYLEGAAAFLDAPGEWWPDFDAGLVYYIPREGEQLATANAVIPFLPQILRLVGDPEHNRPIEKIILRDLTFAHARWWFGPPGGPGWASPEKRGFVQSAWGVPGAITARGAQRIAFERCTVAHVSTYGVEFGEACRENKLTGCVLMDLGAGGVKIGTTAIPAGDALRTGHNTIADCEIVAGGKLHHQAIGVWIGQSDANTLSHNRIHEFDYSGISIGWTWGYGPSAADHNMVEFNEVDHLGDRPGNSRPPLGDMAGIYTLGGQPGTTIRNNHFHDIAGRSIAWGIYFDEGSTGVLAENNLVVRTSHGGFHQHYGKDNLVRNNVFVEGGEAQLWRSRAEAHRSFTLERNIIYFTKGKLFANDWSGSGFDLRTNLYWSPNSDLLRFPGGLTLEQWQVAGHDAGSRAADPLFVAPDKGDFRLKPDSPALPLGFVPCDWSSVGPRRKP